MKNKFKRTLSALSAFVLAFAPVPTAAIAVSAETQTAEETTETAVTSGTCGTSLTWDYDTASKTLTIAGTGSMTNWYYTSDVPWYDVREEISMVVLPDGLTNIGSGAFFNCSALTAIEIPTSVTSIGASAFRGCTNLTAAAIPEGVTTIGSSAFSGCQSLTSAVIPVGVTTIEAYTFYSCAALTDITIPDSVTQIGADAFSYTPWLEAKQEENPLVIINAILIDGTTCSGEVTIPDGVTSIGDYAFYYCTGLTGITIPDSVTSIGAYAFYLCSGLSSVTIPDSVTGIGDAAFDSCTSLTTIVIPDSVKSIGNYAFDGCTALTEITLPDSVTGIGGYAFRDCTALTAVTILNPYCQIYDAANTIPSTATIYSYPDALVQNYADRYSITFVALDGEPSVQYTYEVLPLLSPFNEYFFVKTNNPDPASFRFTDKTSAYSDDAVIKASTTQFADVAYEDPETLRVNGGYIFYSGSTDGGEVSLQMKTLNDTWEDLSLTLTLPVLSDDVDYLIDTYATESDFFANMDAVQAGFSSICLYSGSYIRGELYQSDTYWSVSTSPHIDQHFYIYSPYSRRDNGSLFATAIYPFRYDSLGFPSIMASVSQRLDSTSTYAWSETSHAHINVTYGDETRSYGGAGNGEGQGLSEDKISRFFTFDENDEAITLDTARQLLDDYAAVEMEDDIPREDALTWEQICNTVDEGAWARMNGGYAYLYKSNDQNSYTADEWGVGNSLYWWGSLGYGCDTWVDGRYINSYERFVPGETFEEHPESDIILFDIPVPVVNCDVTSIYNSETGTYETVYSNIEITETIKNVRYTYNSTEGIWTANSSAISYSDYNAIIAMTEQGLIDEKYLDALQLTYNEAVALEVDRNTNINPMHYYLYNGTAAPGTEVCMGDVDNDGTMHVADLVLLQKWLLSMPDTELANWRAADFSGDNQLSALDLAMMKRALLRQ